MEEILLMATLLAPVIVAIVEVIKLATGLKSKFKPLVAVVIGLVIGALATFIDAEIGIRLWAGVIGGLASTGLFSLGQDAKQGIQKGTKRSRKLKQNKGGR